MRQLIFGLAFLLLIAGCGEARLNQKKKHFLHKGNIAFKERLLDESIRYYQEALELDPEFAQAYNNLGIVYIEQERFENAYQSLSRCVELDPEFIEAYFNRSTANYGMGNYRGSLNDLRSIDGVYGPPGSIDFSKGLAFFGLKQYDSAALCFTVALQADSLNVDRILNLATAHYFLKNYAEAEKLLDSSLELDPYSPVAYNLLGMIEIDYGSYDRAIELFNRGIAFKSNDAFIYNNRGYAFLMMNELDKALEDINESILLNADNAWAYRNKGIYYYLLSEFEDSRRLLTQSLQMDSSMPLSHFYLGEVNRNAGSLNLACDCYKKSASLGEDEGIRAYQKYCQ